jgi:hypothetical protein
VEAQVVAEQPEEPLSSSEQSRLSELETTIGRALAEIRDEGLYRLTHAGKGGPSRLAGPGRPATGFLLSLNRLVHD